MYFGDQLVWESYLVMKDSSDTYVDDWPIQKSGVSTRGYVKTYSSSR